MINTWFFIQVLLFYICDTRLLEQLAIAVEKSKELEVKYKGQKLICFPYHVITTEEDMHFLVRLAQEETRLWRKLLFLLLFLKENLSTSS